MSIIYSRFHRQNNDNIRYIKNIIHTWGSLKSNVTLAPTRHRPMAHKFCLLSTVYCLKYMGFCLLVNQSLLSSVFLSLLLFFLLSFSCSCSERVWFLWFLRPQQNKALRCNTVLVGTESLIKQDAGAASESSHHFRHNFFSSSVTKKERKKVKFLLSFKTVF